MVSTQICSVCIFPILGGRGVIVVLLRFCLSEVFKIRCKIVAKAQRFHDGPCCTYPQPPSLSASPTREAHIIPDEPTPTQHYHPKSRLHLVHSVGLDRSLVTVTHHCGLIQSIFTALKILCVLPLYPSPLSASLDN